MIEKHQIQAERGYVLGVALQVVLVLLVLGQIVFLASRYRSRVDLTAEKFFTLTDSTRSVLGKLEDRLQIEAYFSPDEALSTTYAESRRTLREVLDEYVQNGRGRVAVQYFDPQSDKDLRERAERLGITAQTIGDRGDRSLSYKELWQGLRIRYGGKKQKVLPVLPIEVQGQPITAPFLYEMTLTPAIKAVTVSEKPKIAYAAYPSQGARGAQNGFNQLRSAPAIMERYAMQVVSLQGGQLIQDDIETLLLIRPKDLGDREKYVLDQFLMRGGKIVLFADTDDYSIEPEKMFNRRVISYDAKGSKTKFLEQLAGYGIDLDTTVLFDMLQDSREPMAVMMGSGGLQFPRAIAYPYWFHPVDVDYAEKADVFAKGADGKVDEAILASYRDLFLPGIDPEIKGLGAPGMFWATPVGLQEDMPEGLTGKILLRTSPLAIEVEPPQTLSPFDRARQPQQIQVNYRKFISNLQGRINTEQRRQYGVMAEVKGEFKSAWVGKEPPLSPAAKQAEEERLKKEAEAKDAEAKEGEDEAEPIGPPIDEDETPEVPEDPDPVLASTEPGRLIVIGDSDFLRDDLLTGTYGQLGPVSRSGGTFFLNLLDWIAEDQDLFELRNKVSVDRSMKLISEDERQGKDLAAINDTLRDKQFWVRLLNIVLPPALLLGFGLLVFLKRRTAKRSFLKTIEG